MYKTFVGCEIYKVGIFSLHFFLSCCLRPKPAMSPMGISYLAYSWPLVLEGSLNTDLGILKKNK